MPFENFVRCELESGITNSVTSFDVLHAAPYNRPPDPAGGVGRMVIRDSLRQPTAFEIITYTGATEVDSETTTLTGVTRGTEGTTAQAWDAGAVAAQDVTAADLQLLSLQNPGQYVIGGSNDNSVRKHDIHGNQLWSGELHEAAVMAVSVNSNGESASIDSTGAVYCLNKDGSEKWSDDRSLDLSIVTENVFIRISQSGRVYCTYPSSPDVIVCYNNDGSERWSYNLANQPRGLDVDWSDNAFVSTLDGSEGVVRFNSDGDVVWKKATPFDGPYGKVSVCPDEQALIVVDTANIYALDYGGMEIQSFARDGAPFFIEALSGRMIALGFRDTFSPAESGGVALVDWSGSEDWLISLGGTEDCRWIAASDIGFIAYISTADLGKIRIVDLDGNSLGSVSGYNSKIRKFSIPRISPAHFVGYASDQFRLAVPSYESLAGLPESRSQLLLHQSVVPETPPTDHCWIYFDGSALTVKWDDGTTDVIASKP